MVALASRGPRPVEARRELARDVLAATMAILTESGIGAVTARAVAARIGVPVGSVSYHFDSVRSLLLEASRRVIAMRAQSIEDWRTNVTANTVVDRLAELIHRQLTVGRELTVVADELYILGLRDEGFRAVSSTSIPVLREALATFVSPIEATRRTVKDALVHR